MSTPHTSQVWAGETMSQEAIVVMTGRGGELIAGSMDYTEPVVVALEDWGAFMELHSQAVFLSYDVADLFWKLNLALQSTEHGQTLAKQRVLVEEGRWVDIQLLLEQVHIAYKQRKAELPPLITKFITVDQLTVPERIQDLILLYTQLSKMCQSLAKDATPILPLRHDEYLTWRQQPTSEHIN